MKKIIRKSMWLVAILTIACLALMLICNLLVVNNAKGKVFSDIDSIQYNKVGLLLGTTPLSRITIASMPPNNCTRLGRLRKF